MSECVLWSWQGGVVLTLLFLSILFSKLIPKKILPRDLIFTISALLTPFAGILTSKQIYQSGSNQAILATLGLWLMGKAMQSQGIFSAIPTKMPYFMAPLCGAFFHHRSFLQVRALSGPSCYLFAIGGLATAIGTPTNLLLIALYSFLAPEVASNLFLFLPLAVFPIALSVLFFGKRICLPAKRVGPKPKVWKKSLVGILFLAAIAATFLGAPIGTAFLCAGLFSLMFRAIPIQVAFREDFPLPDLLEIFSAALFYFAMVSSGLNASLAKLIPTTTPFLILSLFFILSRLAISGMPRPVAFAILFSILVSLFAGSPEQILIAGAVVAFASAIKETRPRGATALLFLSIVIPACLFWPK